MDLKTVKKYACVVAILSDAVGAKCGMECASSAVGILSVPGDETSPEQIIAASIDVRRFSPGTYGERWRGMSYTQATQLARVCGLAWELGAIPAEWAS